MNSLDAIVPRLGIAPGTPEFDALVELCIHVENLYEQIDQIEDMVQFCIHHGVTISFMQNRRVFVHIGSESFEGDSLYDAVLEAKDEEGGVRRLRVVES